MGKIVLLNYINATTGFEKLGSLTKIPSKSLVRMFGVISRILLHEGVRLEV